MKQKKFNAWAHAIKIFASQSKSIEKDIPVKTKIIF